MISVTEKAERLVVNGLFQGERCVKANSRKPDSRHGFISPNMWGFCSRSAVPNGCPASSSSSGQHWALTGAGAGVPFGQSPRGT